MLYRSSGHFLFSITLRFVILLVTVSSFALFVIQSFLGIIASYLLEDNEIIGYLIGKFETFAVVPVLNVV